MRTISEIDAELKQLNQRRRELLIERRQLIEERRPEASQTSKFWLDIIFTIIDDHPGISRDKIRIELDVNDSQLRIAEQVLTNTLTTLRRRGWIENHGSRKQPKWYARGRIPRSQWNTHESVAS